MSKKRLKRYYQPPRPGVSVWPLAAVLGGVLLIGLAAFAAWRGQATPKPAPEVTGSARLKVDREQVDLGDVRLGQTVEVSFQLSNVGDQALRFTTPPYVEVVEGC
jgi:hypothetical protein